MDTVVIDRLRAGVAAVMLLLSVTTGHAQPSANASEAALRQAITAHYDVSVLRSGVLLTPKDHRGHVVEVTNGSVAVDGIDVSGAELRRQVGADADAIMQLTYLDVATQRQLFGRQGAGGTGTTAEREPA